MGDERQNLIDKIITNRKRKYGSGGEKVSDPEKYNYLGVPIDDICLQYMLCADVWPLEHLILLFGKEGTAKSSFSLYLAKKFTELGGYAIYIDAEKKPPVDVIKYFFGENVDDNPHFQYIRVDSGDEAQEVMQDWVLRFKELNQAIRENEAGEEVCAIIILDTLAAAMSSEIIESIQTDGHSSATVAPYARKWTYFIPVLTGNLLPKSRTSVVIMNQERREPGMFGSITTPGGVMKEFMSMLQIRFTLASGKASYKASGNSGRVSLSLSVEKNLMGPKGREIELDFCWEGKDKFWFDFGDATLKLMKDFLNSGVDFGPLKDLSYRKYCTSKSLDVSRMDPQDFLELVTSNEEILKAIKEEMGVYPRCKLLDPIKTKSQKQEEVEEELNEASDEVIDDEL